jgi:hypothetical protein
MYCSLVVEFNMLGSFWDIDPFKWFDQVEIGTTNVRCSSASSLLLCDNLLLVPCGYWCNLNYWRWYMCR